MIHELDGRPAFSIAFPLGLQHVLTMFVGNLAPVLIISSVVNESSGEVIVTPIQKIVMIQCAMLVSGLATLLQLYPVKIGRFRIGGGLPIVMGTSFVFVPTMIVIGQTYGVNAIFGATLLGGLAEIALGIFLKPLKQILTSLVIGCVLLSVGLNLLPVGIQYFAGGSGAHKAAENVERLSAAGMEIPSEISRAAADYGSWQNLLIGFTVFLVIVLLQRYGRGMMSSMSILMGIIAGYALSFALGIVDVSAVANASAASAPIPFFIRPEFHTETMVSIALLYVICGLETMGNVNGITVAAFGREATNAEVSGAVIADGVGCMFASAFNALPNTAFGQNAGIVAMTKIVNRWCVATGAFVLIAAGFFPKVGAVFSIMPQSVLGGAVITVFGMIMINGIKLICLGGLTDRKVMVVAVTFGLGYAMSKTPLLIGVMPEPLAFIFQDSSIAVCIVAILANLLFVGRARQ
ncbi:MAG: purine permease [Clostridiales Family XIII bacterium]|jgi:NCS2 family nucleobase:cation symporter-2|nr:purine permease [Clostridiales Family XIII bacterium]